MRQEPPHLSAALSKPKSSRTCPTIACWCGMKCCLHRLWGSRSSVYLHKKTTRFFPDRSFLWKKNLFLLAHRPNIGFDVVGCRPCGALEPPYIYNEQNDKKTTRVFPGSFFFMEEKLISSCPSLRGSSLCSVPDRRDGDDAFRSCCVADP